MEFEELSIAGVFAVRTEARKDQRGSFGRIWCAREMAANGLAASLAQCSTSRTERRGTIRGMHYQAAPHEEAKLVRCVRGRIWDVALDLRSGSPTERKWVSFELTAENAVSLYVPPGVAHGFQTLTDDCEVLYLISEFHHAESARGARWNDPAFGIEWPIPDEVIISERDASWNDYAG